MTPINWTEFKRLLEASDEHGAVWALLELVHDLSPAIDAETSSRLLSDYQTGLFAAAVAAHEYNVHGTEAEVAPGAVGPSTPESSNGTRWQ